MRRIISAAARRHSPSGREEAGALAAADILLERADEAARRVPGARRGMLGGSLAKGTWLAEGADIDIFVGFDPSVPRERFNAGALDIGFAALKGCPAYTKYSEHPYVEGTFRGRRANIVPYYETEPGRWQSAADRSPHHTRLMTSSLTPRMRGDVRALKVFLREAGMYGAEIARQGFSGYVSEVLVLHFGGFEGVVRGMASASRGDVIGKTSKKFDTAVSIADPVDPARNLAAAISPQNMAGFVLLCRGFVERPSAAYFEPRGAPPGGAPWGNVLAVSFGIGEKRPDTAWGQAKRAAASLARQLREGGFEVHRHAAHVDGRAHLIFLLGSTTIPAYHVNSGPDALSAGADAFIEKNRGEAAALWVGPDGRLASLRRRAHTDAASLARSILEGGRAPAGLRGDLGRGLTISTGGRIGKSIKEAAAGLVSSDVALARPGSKAGRGAARRNPGVS
ncbi:MAG: CCA tRNA nucleotidyltransferase [Nitrosopumilus sp.]|nr:CCA tRNA nucleotidyltransferase [Nitrosopumilus sp.]CAI9830843.1 CCA-adding enzyme [Nitrosopumilaceae archaeon]MDA7944537.1 CCA tRNA nucleotidyltransferase [Nitrosopumilus sp.]MDA7952617.1 CCA tRNA nucleotidyltransferase [Nitrosopumilus sp.]MDA7954289.1 CCA tRNA nucleotidyltransferase [Nitrosopumilus sp.]